MKLDEETEVQEHEGVNRVLNYVIYILLVAIFSVVVMQGGKDAIFN